MSTCSIIRNENTGKIQKVLAPNGKESILYKSILDALPQSIELDEYLNEALQKGKIKDSSKEEIALGIWSKVYTPSFKKWFGDWENDPKNASKVVDENGEPMVVYHGGKETFEEFSLDTKDRASGTSQIKKGIYLTNKKNVAKTYVYSKETATIKAFESIISSMEYSLGMRKLTKEEEMYDVDIPTKVSDTIKKAEKEYNIIFKGTASDFHSIRYDDNTYYSIAGNIDLSKVDGELLLNYLRNDNVEGIKSLYENYIKDNTPSEKLYYTLINLKNPTILNNNGKPTSIYRILEKNIEKVNNAESLIINDVNDQVKSEFKEFTDTHSEITYVVFEPNQIKSLFNEGEFNIQSDNIYYDLSKEERDAIDPLLEGRINKYLESLGVKINEVDKIKNRKGKPIDAVGKANLTKKVIELTQGRSVKTLPEEAAHMITGMLGIDHPIIRQMMNDVVNYSEYTEVKETYKDVYNTENEFRFEAVGKVIANRIIKESTKPTTELTNWFERVLRVLTRLFSNADTTIPGKLYDNFQMLANGIVNEKYQKQLSRIIHNAEQTRGSKIKKVSQMYNMNDSGFISSSAYLSNLRKDLRLNGLSDIEVATASNGNFYLKDNGKKINPFSSEFFDIQEATQEQVIKSLIDSQNNLKGLVGEQENQKYETFSDGIIDERVSDAQQNLFRKNKSKKEIDELQNSPKSQLAKEVGTELHKLAENSINFMASSPSVKNVRIGIENKKTTKEPITPSIITPNQHSEFNNSMKMLMKNIQEKQQSIDKNKDAAVFTEVFVMDKKGNKTRGGTMDLVIVYSDGSIDIYDYKFINFKMRKINGVYQYPDNEIHFMKEKSYDMQISEYKRILQENYGVTKVRNSRILPFDVQYARNSTTGGFTGKLENLRGFTTDVNYLMPIPVASELSEISAINDMLENLFKQKRILEDKVRSNYNTKGFNNSKNELEKLRTSIKNLRVTGNLEPLFDSINATLDNEANLLNDVTKDNLNDLNKMQSEIDLFQALYENMIILVKSKELKDKLTDISGRIAKAKVAIKNKRIDILLSINPEITQTQRELSELAFFSYTDDINHPVFETFSKLLQTVHGNKNRAFIDFSNEIEPLDKALKEWGKSKGLSVLETYEKMIKDGKIISPYSKEYYEKRKKSIEDSNIKWLKDNHKIKDGFKEKYQKELAEEKRQLLLNYKEDSNIYEIKLKNWISKNDLINEDTAWLNIYSLLDNTDIKNPEYSSEFKEIQNTPPLLNYYNFYTQSMRDFNQLVDERITYNFIPNIKKSFLELASNSGGILNTSKQFMEDFRESFKLYQNDEYVNDIDTDSKIPLMFYNEIKKMENGEWVKDNSAKSTDLTKNIMLFSQAVYKKNELVKIQGLVDALKYHIMEQSVYETNMVGKLKKDKYTGKFLESKDSKRNAELFNKHVLALVYDKKIQNKDTIFFNNYSANKTLSNAMTYLSLNSLVLNYVSAFGNIAAGTGNIFIKAAGGTYFNKSQVTNTLKLVASKGQNGKYYKMSEFFNVQSQNWAYEKAVKLSGSKLIKNITLDKAYLLWQKPDNFMSNTIMVSMAQNYGLDANGSVKRLDTLPKGTESIFDKFKEVDGKIESGLTAKQYDSFRNKVMYVARRVKGSNTTETMSAAQMTIYGKSFMFFKNWLPPMATERFQRVTYNATMEEAEYGRYRSFFKDLLTNGFKKQLPRFLLDLATFGKIKYTPGEMTKAYKDFIDNNPDLKNKISETQYIEMRERTIREGISELRMIITIAMLLLAAKMDWDDDGEPDYKKNALTKQLFKLTRRTYLELSFFSDPRSITELVRNPVPIITIGSDLIKLTSNTGDEFIDIITGLQSEEVDKTPLFHYTKKFLPTKHLEKFLEDFQQ